MPPPAEHVPAMATAANLAAKTGDSSSVVLTVIVCTRNRAEKLQRALQAVLTAFGGRQDCEVIVGDNGSTDGTAELVARLASSDPRLRMVVQPQRGVSRAFNAAAARARGALIGCIDDDCYVMPSYVDDVLQAFTHHPEMDYFGGRILLFDSTQASLTTRESLDREEYQPGSILRQGAVQGANMAFRRELLDTLGGYCEQFGPGSPFSGNDIEFATRASLHGFHGAYEPSVSVWHDHGRDSVAAVARMGQYNRGLGAFYMHTLLELTGPLAVARRLYWRLLRAARGRALRRWLQVAKGALHYVYLWIRNPRAFRAPRLAGERADGQVSVRPDTA